MIDFTNTEVAFKMKTKNDLRQSKLLFATLSSPQVVQTLKGLTLASLFLKLPIKGIVKATVFRQFCGGESVEECQPQIDRLAEGNVQAILDYSVEGKAEEADFDRTLETTLDTIRFAQNNPGVPFGVFKPTGVGGIEWYEKVSLKHELSTEESESWARVLARWEKIFMLASEMKIPVMIDAEESWIQPVVDELAFGFMAKYNTQTPIVYNTAQLYRHDRLEQLKMALARAKEEGFIYGVKIVRGAYMEKERKRAEAKGYTDPIQPNKAATDRDYNAALELILSNLEHMAVVVGTHNEASIELAATLMTKHSIAFDSRRVYVAQLFGMSDHISFNAANSGLNVAKYLPFGPVKDVLPYLFRRAEENTAVEGQTGRELGLLTKELDRRKNA
ncbi:MAG: proline dehydrogenase family protein [Schleiferiaceae bacterium]|nr:proline dehydrogenase family protein [Schleiferiaceae bacterium]